VKEIYDVRNGKRYFSLAFPNNSGGYSRLNPYFKGVMGKKDISLLFAEIDALSISAKKKREKERTG
jgi:hypothetical protein